MVIDNITIFGKTVDSVKNTMIDNIHIKGGQAPMVWDDDFHFAKDTNASGLGVAECENSVDEPIRGLTISGSTGSSTTNLLDLTTPKITTNSGMTVTRNNNELAFSGTLQTWQVYIPDTPLILKDGNYILSCSKYYTYGSVGVRAQIIATPRPNLGLTTIIHQGWGGAIKFIIDNTKYTYIVRVQAGPTAGEFNETLRWWLNEGDIALEYEPFEPVTAVPTKLTVESENYFTPKVFTSTVRGVTMSWDGEYLTLNGTAESDGNVQQYIGVGGNTTATGDIRITAEYISGTLSNNTEFWIGFLNESGAGVNTRRLTLSTTYTTNLEGNIVGTIIGNLFAVVKTGYTYNNAKWRIRIEEYEPQIVTIPSDYDMSKGNDITVDTLNNTVKYNSTDITTTEFGQKLLALEAYDGYTRARVDSNVPVPIETNYWKQIKP